MINRHHCYCIWRMEMIQELREGLEVGWWKTWTAQKPVWPVFVVSHWTGSSFFDLLHAFPRLSYGNSGQTQGGNVAGAEWRRTKTPSLFSASFPRYISSFLASSPLKQLDRLWHERKWVDSGWERWGWHSRCDPRLLWGSSVLQLSLVMCVWSFIFEWSL